MSHKTILIIYVFIIVALHTIPTGSGVVLNKIEIVYFRADYLLHTLLFLPWMILVGFHLNRKNLKRELYLRYLFYWFLAGVSLAVFSEAIQLLLSYRSFNPMDVVFNAAGVVAGGLSVVVYERFFR